MENKEKKGGLILSPETIVILRNLKGEYRDCFLDCILDYHENGSTPSDDVSDVVNISFKVFRMTYDNDQKKYKEKCEKLRNNALSKKADASKSDQMQADASKSNQIGSNNNNNNNSNVTNVTEEDKEEVTAEPSLSLSPEYQSFLNWLNENCKNLLSMKIPTQSEYEKLLTAAGNSKQVLTDKLLAMDNNKKVPKEKRSIYRTCLEWLKRDNINGYGRE